MNIFLVDKDPRICAQALCDLRLNKMILETAQMLCVGYRYYWPNEAEKHADILYKPTHTNHPCCTWLKRDKDNYVWLVRLFKELADEKHFRTGLVHLSYRKLYDILSHPVMNANLYTDYIDFSFNCSNNFPRLSNVFEDYKQCLRDKWKHDLRKPSWHKRGEPAWLNINIEDSKAIAKTA